MESNKLDDSTEFINELSIDTSEDESDQGTNDSTMKLATLNYELKKIKDKTKPKIRSMERKSTFYIIVYKLLLAITAISSGAITIINLGGYTIKYSTALPITATLITGFLGISNLQKKSIKQRKFARSLKKILQRCEKCIYIRQIENKIKSIDKIRNDLIELDFSIYKSDYGIEEDEPSSAV